MVLWECLFFFFDRFDWTTETGYKEEFNSEQTFYTKLTSKIFRHDMIKML